MSVKTHAPHALSFSKADQFRARAKECLRIAHLTPDTEQRARYKELASQYMDLATEEEQLAAQPTAASEK
jgi:hypothetical protein